jgi:glycosyltransferase involved in cell wall biosynthesis
MYFTNAENRGPHIFHFCPSPGTLGGIWTYIRTLAESDLGKKYRLSGLSLERHTHGLDVSVVVELARIFKDARIDVLQIHDLMTTSLHAAIAARLARVPRVISCVHSYAEDFVTQPKRKKFLWGCVVEPIILRMTDGAYNVSAFGAAKPTVPSHSKRNHGLISNAVAIQAPVLSSPEMRARFGFSENDVIGLTVTRADREKGWELLAEAAECLDRMDASQPKLLLVGDGPDLQKTKQRLSGLEKKGKVAIPGRLNNVADLNAIADFVVSPTYREYQAFTFLEAMQQAKPILTTRVGGNAEIVVDGVTGRLISAGSVSELVEGMLWFAKNLERAKEMGQNGRQRLETSFALPRLVAALDRLYAEVLSEPPSR